MKRQTDQEFVYDNLGTEIQPFSIRIDDQTWEGWMYSSYPKSPMTYGQALVAEAKRPAVINLVKDVWKSFHDRDIRLWSHFGVDIIAVPRLPVLQILKYERLGALHASFQNNSCESIFAAVSGIFSICPFEILFADYAGLEAIFLNPVNRSNAEYFQEIIYSISIDSADEMFHELYEDEVMEDADERMSTIVIDYILQKQKLRLYWN